jgi:hypothetical protein
MSEQESECVHGDQVSCIENRMRASLSRRFVLSLVIVLALVAIATVLLVREYSESSAALAVDSADDSTMESAVAHSADGSPVAEPRGSERSEKPLERGELAGDPIRTVVEPVSIGPAPISGRVQWPDGKPASECSIDCAYTTSIAKGRSFGQVRIACDANGAFSTPELDETAVVVLTARCSPPNHAEPIASPWVGHVEGIRSGARDVILVLCRGLILRGSVRDDTGSIQAKARVRASPVHRAWPIPTNTGAIQGTFDESCGKFEVTGLYPGTWNVSADCPGFAKGLLSVDLPGDGVPVQLVLKRFAILSGVLVDGSDRPVADGRVSVGIRRQGAIETSYSFSSSSGSPGLAGEVNSDPNGRFSLMAATPGRTVLSARKEDASLWGTLELDLQPGESRSDLKVVLLPTPPAPPK